jgi:hypothetical protein
MIPCDFTGRHGDHWYQRFSGQPLVYCPGTKKIRTVETVKLEGEAL